MTQPKHKEAVFVANTGTKHIVRSSKITSIYHPCFVEVTHQCTNRNGDHKGTYYFTLTFSAN